MTREQIDIIKIGGSILSNKKSYKKLNRRLVSKICDVIADYNKSFVLIHGAGSFGHFIADKFDINSGYYRQEQIRALAQIRKDMSELSMYITTQLLKRGLTVIPFQTSAIVFLSGGQHEPELFIKPIIKAIELGIIPLLSGDIIFRDEHGFSIISGDRIIRELVKRVAIKRIIFITDVDGIEIVDKNTQEKLVAQEINYGELEDIKLFDREEKGKIDVTGMMKGKLAEIKESLKQGVSEVIIVNGKYPQRVEEVLRGKKTICTIIKK